MTVVERAVDPGHEGDGDAAVRASGEAGNQTASKYTQPGLWAWLEWRPREQWPTLIRGDIAWGTERMMEECEKRDLPYVFKVRQTRKGKRQIEKLFGRADWTAAGARIAGAHREERKEREYR